MSMLGGPLGRAASIVAAASYGPANRRTERTQRPFFVFLYAVLIDVVSGCVLVSSDSAMKRLHNSKNVANRLHRRNGSV